MMKYIIIWTIRDYVFAWRTLIHEVRNLQVQEDGSKTEVSESAATLKHTARAIVQPNGYQPEDL